MIASEAFKPKNANANFVGVILNATQQNKIGDKVLNCFFMYQGTSNADMYYCQCQKVYSRVRLTLHAKHN